MAESETYKKPLSEQYVVFLKLLSTPYQVPALRLTDLISRTKPLDNLIHIFFSEKMHKVYVRSDAGMLQVLPTY